MTTRGRLIGVLLAAGRSRRMGRTKQLMPWPPGGETPLVAVAFDALATLCDRLVVVVGHEADAVVAALAPRRFTRVDADPDAEMFASIRAGIRAAQTLAPGADVAIQPADHPRFGEATAERLRSGCRDRALRALLPNRDGRPGHPVVLPAALLPAVLLFEGGGGLRAFWERHPRLVRRIPVDDPDVTRDLDTPADLKQGQAPY